MTFTQALAALWLGWGAYLYLRVCAMVAAVRQGRGIGEINVLPWLLLGVILAVAVLL